jgi:nitrite reductase (NADH) large subunit
VTDILNAELKKRGTTISNHVCEHFAFSRSELCQIIKVKELKTFDAVLADHGRGGHGCEICKPAVAGILAMLWNEPVHAPEHRTLQDSNDRFLANVQRGGSYSVIPRIPGGEITPEQLIVLGKVALALEGSVITASPCIF